MIALEQFSADHSKLKQATCAIMASQLLTQEEKDHIDDVFRHLDTSCDGQLDRDDLRRGYKEYFDTELPDKEVDKLMKQVNFSGSGAIEYSEFAIAILMSQDKVDEIWGMDVIVCTTAPNDDEARELLRAFNFPFTK